MLFRSMEFRLQAKLLRAIEEQRVMRVGGHDFRPVNVRVLAALNEEPLELVRTGILREDLYYRLRVIQIDLPQLRERREDIRSLTAHFIEKFNREMNKSILDVDRETATFFQSYSWPGNVRELANAIEGAFNFAEGQFIHMDDIGLPRKHSGEDFFGLHAESGMTLKELVRRYERLLIEESLTRCRSTAEVAEDLGITRQNLNHKLKNYNLDKYFDVDKKI